MTDLPIRSEAVGAAWATYIDGGVHAFGLDRMRIAILAFCEAEGLVVERVDRDPEWDDGFVPKQRLRGPWRDTGENP